LLFKNQAIPNYSFKRISIKWNLKITWQRN
jgi:hypothetical protein